MTLFEYVKDKIMLLLMQVFCMGGSFLYLHACQMKSNQLVLLYIWWCGLVIVWLITGFQRRKRYFMEIEEQLEKLDKPYLIAEVMPDSWRLEDRLYRQILRRSNKSVIDEVHALETEQNEYKEFIENWIHEVKLPITAMQLICDNNRTSETRKIKAKLSLLINDVEKALFYARSDTVYKDYMIREIKLKDTVVETIGRNQQFFIQNGAAFDVELGEEKVYCDDKWLAFILTQIFLNAVKYKRGETCHMRIQADRTGESLRLAIEDDGVGIKENELDRIFDKGFTGTNGRTTREATGLGLYLCRKLCQKLGIYMEAESEEGNYTRIILTFPDGSSHFGRS